ncbi:MAG: hypothetical protein U0975_16255 [Erythrobacter sp.]|nr:hypothetical protein [Erythrobacter sp.]
MNKVSGPAGTQGRRAAKGVRPTAALLEAARLCAFGASALLTRQGTIAGNGSTI